MIELTETQKDFIRENYPNKTRKEMAEILGYTLATFERLVRRNKLHKKKPIDPVIGDVFDNLKVVGIPFIEDNRKRVSCECLLCGNTKLIRMDFLKAGASKCCGCYNKRGTKYSVNHKFFDTWSSDMAYLLGFFTADGCVSLGRFRITLQARDVEILEYMKDKLEYTGPIRLSKQGRFDCCSLEFPSKDIVNRFKSYGICEQKTGKEVLPDIPDEYFYSYLRGFFDGDGCIYYAYDKGRKYIKMNFACSNRKFLEKIKEKCEKERGGNIGCIIWSGGCYYWMISYYDSLFLGEKFYSSGGFALQRKKDRWIEACKFNYKSIYSDRHAQKMLSLSC